MILFYCCNPLFKPMQNIYYILYSVWLHLGFPEAIPKTRILMNGIYEELPSGKTKTNTVGKWRNVGKQRKEAKWEADAKKTDAEDNWLNPVGKLWRQGGSHPEFSWPGAEERKYFCSCTPHIQQSLEEGCPSRDTNYQALQESRLWQPEGSPLIDTQVLTVGRKSRPQISEWKWWRIETMWKECWQTVL